MFYIFQFTFRAEEFDSDPEEFGNYTSFNNETLSIWRRLAAIIGKDDRYRDTKKRTNVGLLTFDAGNRRSQCTGSLILEPEKKGYPLQINLAIHYHSKWVLTAAHCVHTGPNPKKGRKKGYYRDFKFYPNMQGKKWYYQGSKKHKQVFVPWSWIRHGRGMAQYPSL